MSIQEKLQTLKSILILVLKVAEIIATCIEKILDSIDKGVN